MARRKRASHAAGGSGDDDVNLTPMLDVVFIMLIFFIVTASFIKESGLDVNRPDAPTQSKPNDENILVVIADNNDILIDNRRIDPRAVRANIERLHAENPEGSVVIKAHKDSYNETLVVVMDSARDAGVKNVSMAD